MQSKSQTHTTSYLIELLTDTPTLTNVELADTLGVTRQRVSQIRRHLNLPAVPSRKVLWHPCRRCGKPIRARSMYCNRVCQYDHVALACETCGETFYRSKRVVAMNEARNTRHVWCSKQCQGTWFGGLKRRLVNIVSR
jgi:hypothetical protein